MRQPFSRETILLVDHIVQSKQNLLLGGDLEVFVLDLLGVVLHGARNFKAEELLANVLDSIDVNLLVVCPEEGLLEELVRK